MGKRQEWVQIPCPILGKCDQDIAEVDLAKDHAWSSASYEARGGIFNGISLTLISHLVGHSGHVRKAQSVHLFRRQALTYSYLQNPRVQMGRDVNGCGLVYPQSCIHSRNFLP